MATAEKQSQFSWRRGVAYALIPFGLVVVGGIAAASAVQLPAERMAALGQKLVGSAMLTLLFGLAVSFFVQTRRRVSAWIAGVFTGLAVVAGIAGPILELSRNRLVPLGEEDRRGLTVEDGRVVHRVRGFSFELPAPNMAPSEAAAVFLAGGPAEMELWAYARGDALPLAVVQLHRESRVTEESLRDYVHFIRDGFVEAPTTSVDVLDEHVSWQASFKGSHMRAVMNDVVRVRLSTWVLPGDEYVVTVLLGGEDAAALERSVQSFRID